MCFQSVDKYAGAVMERDMGFQQDPNNPSAMLAPNDPRNTKTNPPPAAAPQTAQSFSANGGPRGKMKASSDASAHRQSTSVGANVFRASNDLAIPSGGNLNKVGVGVNIPN